MKKYLLWFFSFPLLGLILSCVPPDPAMVYGWNTNTPAGITGPRILHKIDSANVTRKEYVSSPAGVLETVKYYDTDDVIKLFYNSNNKVSKMTLTDPDMSMDLNFSYNSANKITNAVMTTKMNNSNQTVMEETHYWLVYNNVGQLIKADRKSKLFPSITGPFTHYGVINLTWAGDNIVKVMQNNSGIIHPDGSMEPLDPMASMVYKFEDYDNKINPYTTFPAEFNIGMGILAPLTFFQCSYNNHQKLQMEFLNMPVTTYGNYIYDTQNYPVSDVSGITKYIYKPVQ